jgi:putative flavoprotein involved in K+ transport
MASLTNVSTVVIGAGHAGLAMSFRLTERSIDHVVLERGEVANTWRTERWDSLRLLTPNVQTRLPGVGDGDADPDGFMTMPEVVELIDHYAATIEAPVQTGTTVTSVTAIDDGYAVATDRGVWWCTTLVLASGAANLATVPAIAEEVPITRAARGGRRARRWRFGDGRPTGRRDPSKRPPSHSLGRRTRADAKDLSRA